MDKRCLRSSSEIELPSEVPLIKTDDFHPVRALACRILTDQLHSAACLVDRVGRNRVRLFPSDDKKSSLGINRKSARLLLGRRTAQKNQLAAGAIDTEGSEGIAGALRHVKKFAVRCQMQICRPDIVVDVSRRRPAGRAYWASRRSGHELGVRG